ncbi:MAG: zinc ribbon domain-containing protein [Candidatus Polarisedimenticolaceae bacterium]|nr:zinc ribbon domain-containing protein [Candidatus Polarisedimenticolaceae bacterium]
MPIYEYRCDACGHELETIQKMADAPLVDCPACEKSSLKKLISAVAFRLKGSGWYETDFKKGDKKNLHDSGSSAKKSDAPPCAATGSCPNA